MAVVMYWYTIWRQLKGLHPTVLQATCLFFFFSTSTIFNLFTSSIMLYLVGKDNELLSFKC